MSDDERRQKVRELKKWLAKKEEEEAERNKEMTPMDKLIKAASKSPISMDKLEQDHMEMRERRSCIADQKRTAMAMNMAATQLPQRVLHRHVHHHVHYHDGASDDEAVSQNHFMPPIGGGMGQSASAGNLRSTAPATGMPWRPLVHSASAGGIPDPRGFDRTVEAFRGPGAGQ